MYLEVKADEKIIRKNLSDEAADKLLSSALIVSIKTEKIQLATGHYRLIKAKEETTFPSIFSQIIDHQMLRDEQLLDDAEVLEAVVLTEAEILNWFYFKFSDDSTAQMDLIQKLDGDKSQQKLISPSITTSVNNQSSSFHSRDTAKETTSHPAPSHTISLQVSVYKSSIDNLSLAGEFAGGIEENKTNKNKNKKQNASKNKKCSVM